MQSSIKEEMFNYLKNTGNKQFMFFLSTYIYIYISFPLSNLCSPHTPDQQVAVTQNRQKTSEEEEDPAGNRRTFSGGVFSCWIQNFVE